MRLFKRKQTSPDYLFVYRCYCDSGDVVVIDNDLRATTISSSKYMIISCTWDETSSSVSNEHAYYVEISSTDPEYKLISMMLL